MECRAREGSEWLANEAAHWSRGNQLIHHLWWHRALMQLELGELDAVLESYDQNIRNLDAPMTKATPDHFVDLQNAPALLWRLERMGVDVGRRWEELADKAEARIGEAGHPLLVPHLMMALEEPGGTPRPTVSWPGCALSPPTPAGGSLARLAMSMLPVCEAARAHRRGDYGSVVELLAPRRQRIRLLGGSNVQRDLFMQMLIDAAMKADRRELVPEMIAHETATRAVPPIERNGYAGPKQAGLGETSQTAERRNKSRDGAFVSRRTNVFVITAPINVR